MGLDYYRDVLIDTIPAVYGEIADAEALMNLRPWAYWAKDGEPYPGTTTLVAQLERVMSANPDHPGACHYYIHAVEAVAPEKAVQCAERLASLMLEPPQWAVPIRWALGAALLKAGRPADAERVYLEDLRRFPENGWSLHGLGASLRAQGKAEEAIAVDARLAAGWSGADVRLAGSRF